MKNHFNVLAELYSLIYNLFPDFDLVFDEETFYLTVISIVLCSIAICFLLSRFITLHEANF